MKELNECAVTHRGNKVHCMEVKMPHLMWQDQCNKFVGTFKSERSWQLHFLVTWLKLVYSDFYEYLKTIARFVGKIANNVALSTK